MSTLTVGATSLVGQVRSANEDSFLVAEDLVAVADGMGGHRAGEVASADTVEVLRSAAGSRAVEDLVAAVHRANRGINERAAEDDELRGMGTTVCVVGQVRYDDEDQVAVLNVGDSRVYLLAAGVLTQLTEDHSLVETLLREGRITPEEAEHHPQRNVITRALGVEALVVVDAWLLRPCDGDRLLLCSDGLFGELPEDRIAEVLQEDADPEVAARRLAAEADAAGGRDNITTVVVDVSDTGAAPATIDGRYRRISTPAVDMSDRDDGPHTDTVLAVVVPSGPDLGASPDDEDIELEDGDLEDLDDDVTEGDALDTDGRVGGVDPSSTDAAAGAAGAAAGVAGADVEGRSSDRRGRRWRTALFVLAVVVLVAVMAGVLLVFSRAGWVVADRDGTVVLLQGPRDGVLFIGPKEVERFDELQVDDLTDADRRRVESGDKFGTEDDARRYIARLEASTTSTTTTTTTTTTVPATEPTVAGDTSTVPDPNATAPPVVGP